MQQSKEQVLRVLDSLRTPSAFRLPPFQAPCSVLWCIMCSERAHAPPPPPPLWPQVGSPRDLSYLAPPSTFAPSTHGGSQQQHSNKRSHANSRSSLVGGVIGQ